MKTYFDKNILLIKISKLEIYLNCTITEKGININKIFFNLGF